MAFLLIAQVPAAYASTLSDLKEENKMIQEKKDALKGSINEKSTEIKTIENKQDKLLTQIQTLDNEIKSTNQKMEQVASDINKTNNDISTLQKDIEALQFKIDQRNELLAERARAIQAGGSVDYLDVLLGANSFVDFIDRFSAVNTLMDADRQIMRDQKEDQKELEEQKLELEKKKTSLEEDKKKLEKLSATLDSQKKEKNSLIDELEAEQEKLASEKTVLEDEYYATLELSEDLKKQIQQEQERIAEIARQQEANKPSGGSNGGTPVISDGTWTRPAQGRFTSGYGYRNIGSGTRMHYGIDIANSVGTPVVAVADGVVSVAKPLSTFGNAIMITHSVNGKIVTSVYAHLNGFYVKPGDTVSKGQVIAPMGNTGRSTGPHLHLEIHEGPWKGNGVNAVNPLRYISL